MKFNQTFSIIKNLLAGSYTLLDKDDNEIILIKNRTSASLNQIEETLSNNISRFSVQMREVLNKIRLTAFRINDDSAKKILSLGDEGLEVVKKFEEETTGKKLLPTPESV